MANLPTYLNPEVGYALWWLTHNEQGTIDTSEIVERLLARGYVRDRGEARNVLRQAQANVSAQRAVSRSTGTGKLAAACGYKCADDTPIALRVRMNVIDANGNVVENRSIVINATAGQNIDYVLSRAQQAFNRRFRSGTAHGSGNLRMDRPPTVADIDQVLLNYSEGQVWA